MFDGISLKNCLPSNAHYIGKPLNTNQHQYSIGRKEWQQNYTTENRMKFTEKDLRNNTANLDDKEYLIPNHSNFEIGIFSNNKGIYQTTNKNDFIGKNMTKEDIENFNKNYIPKNIHNNIIDNENELNNNNNQSIYKLSMIDPKKQKVLFDYNDIHFKENKEIFDTITQEVKMKNNNNWAFDYYNEEKNKLHKRLPYSLRSINDRLQIRRRFKPYRDNKQVWDPIANRFFQCPNENDKKIESLRKEK
jgi:hypothetical protein